MLVGYFYQKYSRKLGFSVKRKEVLQKMKRYGNIYSKIYDLDNLRLAYKMAKKDE